MAEQPTPDVDPLFVGLTRPATAFGVTYSYFIIEAMVSVITFLVSDSLLGLLLVLPMHGVGYAACRYDPRIFDLTFKRFARVPPVRTKSYWRCNTYRP